MPGSAAGARERQQLSKPPAAAQIALSPQPVIQRAAKPKTRALLRKLSLRRPTALFQPLADSIHPRVVMAELIGIERVSIFQNGPPGAMKLALLCSRQI